ncbi:Uncharacterised protein [Mycobacterium tuberculosis]|nr:Uncharacterised protein [Mycobacterium tuberculosis]
MSLSNCEPMMVESAFMAKPIAPVTNRPMPRPGASSSRHSRLSMKLPKRFGASRKSSALREGGVSTTIRSQRS